MPNLLNIVIDDLNLYIEMHQIFPENVVLGVTNEGISDTLNRIKGATDKDAQYAEDKDDMVFSAFDQLEPYTSMQIVVDNTATPLFIEVDGIRYLIRQDINKHCLQ